VLSGYALSPNTQMNCAAPRPRRPLVGLRLGNTRALPAVNTCAARHVPGHKPERGSPAAVGPLPRPIAATAPRELEPREATIFSTGQIRQISLKLSVCERASFE
jgi:hypothetical protein